VNSGEEAGTVTDWFGLAAEAGAAHADLVVFGIPYDASVFFRRGAAEAPQAIRALSSKLPPAAEDGRLLTELRVLDLGDVEVDPSLTSVEPMSSSLRQAFREARARGLPLALGGDHSISIPLIAEAVEWAGRDVGLLWIDAHPDLCDSFNGSPYSHACVMRRALESRYLAPENVVMVGIRSCEVEEVEYLQGHPVQVVTARDAMHASADDIGRAIGARFADMPVYLSIDIDAFDPAYAPGTGIPDAGGLSTRWVLDLLHRDASLDLVAVDLVEVAPPLDVPSSATSLLALKLILEILGGRLP
jgi:agmatinase